MDHYGASKDNPIKLKDSESAIIMLNHIVTESEFHILYHLKNYVLEKDSIIELYEVFSGEEKFYLLYFEITNDVDQWIPPSGFLFKFNWIEYSESNFIYHGQNYYYTGDESCDKPFTFFHSRNWEVLTMFLYENCGVNYKSDNFPESIFKKYYNEFGET